MKKLVSLFIVVSLIFVQFFAVTASAQELGTLIPEVDKKVTCVTQYDKKGVKVGDEGILNILEKEKNPSKVFTSKSQKEKNDILGCAIMSGRIQFWMVPYYIVYVINFLLGIAGLLAILFIVIAGFQFIMAGATEKKDTAKGTIKNALLGLVLVMVAWVVVNIVQYVITI